MVEQAVVQVRPEKTVRMRCPSCRKVTDCQFFSNFGDSHLRLHGSCMLRCVNIIKSIARPTLTGTKECGEEWWYRPRLGKGKVWEQLYGGKS